MKIAFCVVALAGGSLLARSQEVVYDINFQSPDQAVDQVVRTGVAPDHVSSIAFGSPRVVAAFGALTGQPLLFSSAGQPPAPFGYYYTQIGLAMSEVQAPALEVSFDFVDRGRGHFFTVLFDTPNVRNFNLFEGKIWFDNPVLPSVPIGDYQMGAAYHFTIRLDYERNQWTFTEDHRPLAEGRFDPETDRLRSIRFNYSAGDSGVSGTAIDNLAVVIVPEPRTLFWWGVIVLGVRGLVRGTVGRAVVGPTGGRTRAPLQAG